MVSPRKRSGCSPIRIGAISFDPAGALRCHYDGIEVSTKEMRLHKTVDTTHLEEPFTTTLSCKISNFIFQPATAVL